MVRFSTKDSDYCVSPSFFFFFYSQHLRSNTFVIIADLITVKYEIFYIVGFVYLEKQEIINDATLICAYRNFFLNVLKTRKGSRLNHDQQFKWAL